MKKILFVVASVVLPGVALAQSTTYFQNLLTQFGRLLNQSVIVLISLAVVWFIWNVFGYIRSANDEEKKAHTAGMVWGIIGLAVIVSVWGLVGLLQTTFGVNSDSAQRIDKLLPR